MEEISCRCFKRNLKWSTYPLVSWHEHPKYFAELTEVALQFFLEEAIWNVVNLKCAGLVRRYGSSLLAFVVMDERFVEGQIRSVTLRE